MAKSNSRRSYRLNKARKAFWFRPGNTFRQTGQNLPSPTEDIAVPSVPATERLSAEEAVDVLHASSSGTTLPYKLRPKAEIKDIPDCTSVDENVIVNMQCLRNIIQQVHQQNCKNSLVSVSVVHRRGLAISICAECRGCHYKSTPMELSNTIKKPRGPGAGVLNEMILLPVMKSKMGMADVSLVLSCLNIKPPSDSLMQKKMNLMSDKATTVNEDEMCNNQHYVSRILTLSGKDNSADVQFDTSFSCRPQGGAEKAKQSFAPLIEHNTSKKFVLAASISSKFCKKKACTHDNCSKTLATDQSISSTERSSLHTNLNSVLKRRVLNIRSVTTDASSQVAKALRDYNTENKTNMKHYHCFIHKLRTLEKKIRNINLNSKLKAGQNKTIFLKSLASGIRTRARMELTNLKSVRSNEAEFIERSTKALENIVPCFADSHVACSKQSTVCQHHLVHYGKYSVKHLPYGQHLTLSKDDQTTLKDAIMNTFNTETLRSVKELYSTNQCESMHSTIFNYAPKFTCWTRNFSGLCHSATHSRTLGRGRATLILARAVGINVKKNSQMYMNLNRIDQKSQYHSRRKKSQAYKQSRYFLRKRVSNRPLLQESLYSCEPSTSSQDHSYGIKY